jgi:hypothetical protein
MSQDERTINHGPVSHNRTMSPLDNDTVPFPDYVEDHCQPSRAPNEVQQQSTQLSGSKCCLRENQRSLDGQKYSVSVSAHQRAEEAKTKQAREAYKGTSSRDKSRRHRKKEKRTHRSWGEQRSYADTGSPKTSREGEYRATGQLHNTYYGSFIATGDRSPGKLLSMTCANCGCDTTVHSDGSLSMRAPSFPGELSHYPA